MRCLALIESMGLGLPTGARYAQLNVSLLDNGAERLSAIDRGWVVELDTERFEFLNDRLLTRVYSRSAKSNNLRVDFEYIPTPQCNSEFLFADSNRANLDARDKLQFTGNTLVEDYRRYPLPNSEWLRLLHLLFQVKQDEQTGIKLLRDAEAINFKVAESNGYLTAVRCRKDAIWEERVKVAFANYFFNLAYRMVSDAEGFSVDECQSFFQKLTTVIEREGLESKVEFLRQAIEDLELWKREMQLLVNRGRIRVDEADEVLKFLMTVGNCPSRDLREGFVFDRKTSLNLEERMPAMKKAHPLLRESEVPSRCVDFFSPPTFGPRIVTVRSLIYTYGRSKSLQ